MKTTIRQNSQNGGAFVWLLVLLAIGVALFFYLKPNSPSAEAQPTEETVQSTPAPAPAAEVPAKPEPAAPIAAATPKPAAVAAPAPREIDLATVARNPARWPKTVVLTRATTFPVVINGKILGSAEIPAGSVVHVRRVLGLTLEVERAGAQQIVAASSTNIKQLLSATPAAAHL